MNVNRKCACVVVRDARSGVLRAVSKCRKHVQALLREMRDEERHYASFGAVQHPEVYLHEFEECFGAVAIAPKPSAYALEVGPGTSPYIPMLRAAGYTYTAIEPSPYAHNWLVEKYPDCVITRAEWETRPALPPCALILAAHSIEHMQHGPNAIKDMASYLQPGGHLYIIVPNDEDLCNPDHWWFFDQCTLAEAVTAAGLAVQSVVMRRRIPREQFIYCHATK